MKFSEFYKFIEGCGWSLETGQKGGTKHYRYVHPDHPFSIPVGRHKSQEIPSWLLHQMLRETGLKEEFRKRKKK